MKFQSVAIASVISSFILGGTALPVPVDGPVISPLDPNFRNVGQKPEKCGAYCLALGKRESEPEPESDLVSLYLSNTLHDRWNRANGITKETRGHFHGSGMGGGMGGFGGPGNHKRFGMEMGGGMGGGIHEGGGSHGFGRGMMKRFPKLPLPAAIYKWAVDGEHK